MQEMLNRFVVALVAISPLLPGCSPANQAWICVICVICGPGVFCAICVRQGATGSDRDAGARHVQGDATAGGGGGDGPIRQAVRAGRALRPSRAAGRVSQHRGSGAQRDRETKRERREHLSTSRPTRQKNMYTPSIAPAVTTCPATASGHVGDDCRDDVTVLCGVRCEGRRSRSSTSSRDRTSSRLWSAARTIERSVEVSGPRTEVNVAREGMPVDSSCMTVAPLSPIGATFACLLRLGHGLGRGRGYGRHPPGTHAGARPHHRAAARRSANRPRGLRAAESVGDAHRGAVRARRRPLHRSAGNPGRAHHRRRCAWRRRVRDERGAFVLGAGGGGDAHARSRTERALGDQPGDGRAVVRSPYRLRDGHLQHRDERRLHGRVPGRRISGADVGMARVRGWRSVSRSSAVSRRSAGCLRDAIRSRWAFSRMARGRAGLRGSDSTRGRSRGWSDVGAGARRLPPSGCSRLAPRSTALSRRASASSTNRFWPSAASVPNVYYQTLIVTAMTALIGNFGGGWLATRMSLPRLMAISLFILDGGSGGAAARRPRSDT